MAYDLEKQWIDLLERDGRKVTSNEKKGYWFFYLWKGSDALHIGISNEGPEDALMRLVREYIEDHPHCEAATKYLKHQERANLRYVNQICGRK